jgi:hypothetical protein
MVALAEALVWIVTVVLAELPVVGKVIEEGWKLQLAACGRPVQENCTVPAKPAAALRVSASETLPEAGALICV